MTKFKYYGQRFSVPYIVHDRGIPHFNMRVPRELIARYGKSLIRIRLELRNGPLAMQANMLAEKYKREFALLKADPGLFPSSKSAATTLLEHYGLAQGDGKYPVDVPYGAYPFPHLTDFEAYVERRKHAGTLDATDKQAMELLMRPAGPKLPELFKAYLRDEHRTNDWKKKVTLRWNKFIQYAGDDTEIASFTRDNARAYRDTLELPDAKGERVKSSTVDRHIKQIAAIWNKGLRELGVTMRNPFESIRATPLDDSDQREVFTPEEFKELLVACIAQGDDIRTLYALMIVTGARNSEAVGLRRSDVFLDAPVPYIAIEPWGQQHKLKTKNSRRTVPLHPKVLPLMRAQMEATEGGAALFPRYSDGVEAKPDADSFSGAINKWLASVLGDRRRTAYSARHTVKDLLRNANIPDDRQRPITGHGSQSQADTYGHGRALELKRDDLFMALSCLD